MANENQKSSTTQVERRDEDTLAYSAAGHGQTTWFMIIFSIWVGLFGWLTNFDAAFGGIVLVMEPYKASFGTCADSGHEGGRTCSITALQQSLVQLTVLFEGVGGGLAALTGHYIGRRGTVQMGCLLIAIGAAGMIGSEGSFVSYMVCKCIGGVGMGQLYPAAPTWGSESVSASKRGFLMCLYNVGLGSGNVVAAAICVGSSEIPNNWSWRTPIACQIPLSMLWMGISVLFPESPRWLLVKGRETKPRQSFARYMGSSPDSPAVERQVHDVLRHIALEERIAEERSWTEIFHGLDLKRTHIAVLVLLGNALTGIQFVIPYTALFLTGLGLTNPFALNVAISSCVLAGAIPGPWICEYVGRRRGLLGGYVIMAASMLIFAATASGLDSSDPAAQRVLVAFLCI
jgi:MFS transporter, SP family, sugar:H+ symporter